MSNYERNGEFFLMPTTEFVIRQEAGVSEIQKLFAPIKDVTFKATRRDEVIIDMEICHTPTGAIVRGGVCNELSIDPKKLTGKYRYDTPSAMALSYYCLLLSSLEREIMNTQGRKQLLDRSYEWIDYTLD